MPLDDTASAVPSQLPTLSPDNDSRFIDYGDVLAKSDEVREPIKFGVGIIVHELASQFANHGANHGDTLLSISMGYKVCVEELWKAATFLATRGVIELRDDADEKDSCTCSGCRCRRSWVQFPYDLSVDYDLIRQERDRSARGTDELAARQAPKRGVVYLIQCGERFKIGITNDMRRRLDQLKGQSPYPLELIHQAEGINNSAMESRLHGEFGEHRVHGEWFELSADQVAAVIEAMNDWAQWGRS